MLPAEGLAFPLPLPPNPPNPPNLGGELPKGELVEEEVPKGLDNAEAPKGLEVEGPEDGAGKLNADGASGALDPKIFVGSEGLGVALSLGLERDAAGGNENADALSLGLEVEVAEGNENADVLVLGGKENEEDDTAAVASSFGVNPPDRGVAVEEEVVVASLGPNPEKEAGGVGMDKELTLALAVEMDEDELVFLVS